MKKVLEFVRGDHALDTERTALEILQETPMEQLDHMVARLRKKRPAAEIRDAMIRLLGVVPLSQFETLKYVYLKHFGA